MRAWLSEGLMFLTYLAFGLSWFALSPCADALMSEFHIDKLHFASAITTVSLAKMFVPVLAGFLAARLGLKLSLGVGAMLCALSLVVPLCGTFGNLLALRFLFGVGGALTVTLMGPIAMNLFPRDRLPFVNGMNNVAVNSGIAITTVLTPMLLKQGWDWRGVLYLFGGISAVLAVLWMALGTDAGAELKAAPRAVSFGEAAGRRETWLLAIAFSGPLGLYLSLNTWLAKHLAASAGMSPTDAAALTGLFNLVGIPTAIVSGWLTGKLGLRRPLIVGAGVLMPISALLLCFSPSQALRVMGAVGLGMSLFLYVAPLFTIPTELPGSSPGLVARINGIVLSVSYCIASLAPMLVGKLADLKGDSDPARFSQGLGIFCCYSAALGICGFLLPETGPRGRAASLPSVEAVPDTGAATEVDELLVPR